MPTRPIARLVLGAIVLAHVAASTFAVDPAGLLTSEPFYTDDYPLHFARAAVLADELPRTGRLWAYDTGTLAGYPLGATVFDLDNVGTVKFANMPRRKVKAAADTTVAPAAAPSASTSSQPSRRAAAKITSGAARSARTTTSLNASARGSGNSAIATTVPTLSRSNTVAPSG